jgi:ribose transport system permease protein
VVGRLWQLRPRGNMAGTLRAALVLLVLLVIYAILQPSLLKVTQITNVVNEASVVGLAAVGETIVVLAGGFDLSVGAVLSVVNVIIATHIGNSVPEQLLMIPIALLVGVGIGLTNGLVVTLLRIPSIIATLAMSFFWGGIALLILSQPGGAIPPDLSNWFTGDAFGSVPSAFLLLVLVAVIWLVLKQTPLGRAIYAAGGDEWAAAANGVRVHPTILTAYALSGLFYATAGIFLSAESGSGDPNVGAPVVLSVFAAVVVGGTVLGGGRGDAIGSILGAFILTIIANVLFVAGASSFWTNIFNGAVLLVAVLATSLGTVLSWLRARLGQGRGYRFVKDTS